MGIAPRGRRRTPGLRREEVAERAGVSTTWYTWLEQGRPVRASRQVLDSIARALDLSPAETMHLFKLAGEKPLSGSPAPLKISPAYDRLLRRLEPNPAYIINRRLDLLSWNKGVVALLPHLDMLPPEDRNIVWLMCTDPWMHELIPDWQGQVSRLTAMLRSESADAIDDPEFQYLIRRIEAASPEFRQAWATRRLETFRSGSLNWHHPAAGRFTADYVRLHIADDPRLSVVIQILRNPETLNKLADIIASMSLDVEGGLTRR